MKKTRIGISTLKHINPIEENIGKQKWKGGKYDNVKIDCRQKDKRKRKEKESKKKEKVRK